MYIGNLCIEEIENRTGVQFSEELRSYMKPRRQEKAANVAEGKWHCFDMPFILVCGDIKTAVTIFEQLNCHSDEFKERLQIGVN